LQVIGLARLSGAAAAVMWTMTLTAGAHADAARGPGVTVEAPVVANSANFGNESDCTPSPASDSFAGKPYNPAFSVWKNLGDSERDWRAAGRFKLSWQTAKTAGPNSIMIEVYQKDKDGKAYIKSIAIDEGQAGHGSFVVPEGGHYHVYVTTRSAWQLVLAPCQ
jgi:hypothetical protein